ncbi:Arginine decarboxylase-like protein [Drosera capensis]
MAICSPGDVLILPRNSHISAMSGLVLTGVVPEYIMLEYNLELEIAGTVTSSQVGDAINDLKVEGRMEQLFLLLALLIMLPSSALHQWADISIQSTHKVLCSLTQSSMLHMAGKLVDKERISRCLQTLQSTSSSYLLLASLDAARAQISKSPEAVFHDAIKLANEAESSISCIHPLSVLDSASFSKSPAIDPLRITVGVKKLGLSGYEADEFLSRDQNVVSELLGSHSITFVFTPGTCVEHVRSLVLGLERLSTSMAVMSDHSLEKTIDYDVSVPFSDIRMELNPREAFFAGKRKISFQESIGKVSGELICSYPPPGIPVLAPGEIITQGDLDLDCLLRVRNSTTFCIHFSGIHLENMFRYCHTGSWGCPARIGLKLVEGRSCLFKYLVEGFPGVGERNKWHYQCYMRCLMRDTLQGPLTPLVSALKASAEVDTASFHFPDAQKLAAEVFGAMETWFLVGGTTCGILAAMMATCCPGDTPILPRSSHKSALSALVLAGAVPKYIFPDYDLEWEIPSAVTLSQARTTSILHP